MSLSAVGICKSWGRGGAGEAVEGGKKGREVWELKGLTPKGGGVSPKGS